MSLPQESAEIGAVSKYNRSDTRRVHAVRAAQLLLEAIRSEVHTLLARVDGNSIARNVRSDLHSLRSRLTFSQTDARILTELMAYARHLRSAMRRTPLDYSAIQVFVKWIVQRSTPSSPNHDAIYNCARSLEEIVSLRSGLLLVEIWTSLASLRPSDASRSQVDRLADARNQVSLPSSCPSGLDDHTVDSSTSSSRILEVMSLWTLPQERSTADDDRLLHVTDMIMRVSSNRGIICYWLTSDVRGRNRAPKIPNVCACADLTASC